MTYSSTDLPTSLTTEVVREVSSASGTTVGPADDKVKRQEDFRERCAADGLTARGALERASIFPMLPASQIKVLFWPRFGRGKRAPKSGT